MKLLSWSAVAVGVLVAFLSLVLRALYAILANALGDHPHGPLFGGLFGRTGVDEMPALSVVDWVLAAVTAAVLVATPFLLRKKVAWSRWIAQIALILLSGSALIFDAVEDLWINPYTIVGLLGSLVAIVGLNTAQTRAWLRRSDEPAHGEAATGGETAAK